MTVQGELLEKRSKDCDFGDNNKTEKMERRSEEERQPRGRSEGSKVCMCVCVCGVSREESGRFEIYDRPLSFLLVAMPRKLLSVLGEFQRTRFAI